MLAQQTIYGRGAALFGGIALGVVVALVSAPARTSSVSPRNRIAKSARSLAHRKEAGQMTGLVLSLS